MKKITAMTGLALTALSFNAFAGAGGAPKPAELPSFAGSYELTNGTHNCATRLKINVSGSTLKLQSNDNKKHPSFVGIDSGSRRTSERYIGTIESNFGDIVGYMSSSVSASSAGKSEVEESFSGNAYGKRINGSRSLKLKSRGQELRYTAKAGFRESYDNSDAQAGTISVGVSYTYLLNTSCTYRRTSNGAY